MADDIESLTVRERKTVNGLVKQLHEKQRTYYTGKSPVANTTDLAAVPNPTEGEERLISDDLPQVVKYIYHSTISPPQVACNDGSPGGWIKVTMGGGTGTAEVWAPNTYYVAGDMFDFMSPVDTTDAVGNEVRADTLYGAYYVDGNGDPVDFTSGSTLDASEIGKMIVEDGKKLDQTLSQAEYDALYPL